MMTQALYAWTIEIPPGIRAVLIGHEIRPLVGATREEADAMEAEARIRGIGLNKPVALVRYEVAEVLRRIEP